MNKRMLDAVKKETGITKGWKEIDGPTTGVGVEYWFRNTDGTEVYVCDDQDVLSIDIHRED